MVLDRGAPLSAAIYQECGYCNKASDVIFLKFSDFVAVCFI